MSLDDRLRAIDHFQQRHRRLSFLAGVAKKFGDDQAGQLAALIAYYAFVSLFPLLLVFVTVLGFVLQGDPGARQEILAGTLKQFPIAKDLQLHSLSGNAVALAVGLVISLLAGLGVTNAAQNAFHRIWNVPFKHRPNFLKARLRGLGLLVILGTLNIVSTVVAGFLTRYTPNTLSFVVATLVAFAFNLVLFMASFRLLTAADIGWRELLPGVIAAAIFWQLLQQLGGLYIEHQLKRTGPLYGVFALVLSLIAWLYLGAQLVIFAAEINVVRARRLWPRSFMGQPLLEADRRALSASAEVEERVQEETVEATFDTSMDPLDAPVDPAVDPSIDPSGDPPLDPSGDPSK